MNEKLYNNTLKARDKLFNSLGKVDNDVLAPMANPSLTGGPTWPSIRQAYSIIRTDNSIIIASNGLSDPFDNIDKDNNGFGIEVMAETFNTIKDDDLTDIAQSWLFDLVSSVSQEIAFNGQIKSYIEQHNVITMEINVNHPELSMFQNEDNLIGIMLGVEHPNLKKVIKFPAEEVILVTIKILTKKELQFVSKYRAEGRKKLHLSFQKNKSYHFCDLNRKSLIPSTLKTIFWNIF